MVRSSTQKTVDVHLMIQDPSKHVKMFATMGADIIYIHPEADQQASRTLDVIRGMGKKAGIAINPGTSVENILELLPLIDYVMVMTVNPGFAGQKYLEFVNPKIEKLVKLAEDFNFEILVDNFDCGILICGTGVGISISANKVKSIRAVVCSEPYSARLSKEHNNTNILAFGSRVVGSELAKMIVKEWLDAKFEGGRHSKRIEMLNRI